MDKNCLAISSADVYYRPDRYFDCVNSSVKLDDCCEKLLTPVWRLNRNF